MFERAFPGLLILSSGQGDARGRQGLCQVHWCMVTPDLQCRRFTSTAVDAETAKHDAA
jgi:hypothetical protein